MLEKTFDPKTAEPRLYEAWEQSGAFAPTDDPNAEPFSIVIPPPNVTGSLHIGHALNNTLQDVLIRFERMRGKAALWLPGTDHAGIATQNIVERQLAEAGNISRRDMGREAFVEKIWEWKAKSGGTIVNQLRRLGASCDWSRERFTLDEGLSDAVRKVFVQLHREGLIYRDKRLVNWDPHFQTAISDIEVEQREVDGAYWHFAYPLEDGSGEIVVATTRPETMLGDTAVAVHPDDERYKHLVGKAVRLPIVNRPIQIVADEYPDPEKGSGAVKITPAHDFNDFQVGKRHNLPVINVFDDYARINENAPEAYRGLDRFAARKKVVEEFEALGLLREIEKTRHVVPHGDRSGAVVEPYLTDQWYVDAKTLAGPAIKAVEEGRTLFEPRNWDKTYFEWMRNIQPWCISRQLWWGHRIPAWYGPDGKAFVAETEDEAKAAAREHYGRDEALKQDEDVLDTWFSSGLWPFSTMGWPEKTSDLARFYPTHTLITGFDIIFFWVARMMMQGIHFTGEVPFKRVFINALVRDAEGKKMSKSKGNVLDPLELVDEFGADALRFTLTAMSGQARDIKLSRQRIEGYRNFGTKLWNATRFCQMNGCARAEGFDPAALQVPLNRWIVGEAARTSQAVTKALDGCGFDEAAGLLYRFIWNVYCDWYVELAKPLLNGEDATAKAETQATAAWILDVILTLLHPIMPFLTEELWAQTAGEGAPRSHQGFLMTAPWPELGEDLIDKAAEAEIGLIIAAVSEGRSVRAELNVPPGARPDLLVVEANAAQRQILERSAPVICQTLRVASVQMVDRAPDGAIPFVVDGATLALPVAAFIDLAAERARLSKEIATLASDVERTAKKLGNADFVARAPEEVVEENRERLAEAQAAKAKLEAALQRLSSVG
ncbi:valine--tRNA ligase [Phenylobacterium sp.]|jgi:valyl-tRNA synthetase|uniref:valine--tRNA ligase n=1 Tax=Phenylobacterium sp. TaxID=1871053 RepID=UPI000C8D7483|nr:valine--tRNA ligase [Phenylobacterium sp.]MAK83501.1 valine--tRNA ligase [Phenylobacterium sp.]|tara:strand:- start:24082 stop:26748 length:2667 start_codon:yes stop_codon:yes gene_type:complete